MAARRHRRAIGATGLSLVLHVLALTGLALGVRVVAPPPEDRAMEVSLMPPPRPPPPRIAPVQSASERPSAAPSPRPRPSSAPSLSAPSAPRAEAPPAAPEPAIEYGPVGLQSSLSGKQGCDDPLNIHLTPEQAQVCANNLARLAREARRLAADLADKNRAAFDRQARCRALTAERGVPGSSAADETTGAIRGLGYNPSLKDCRAQDR